MRLYISERLPHIVLVKPLKHSYYTASELVSTAPPQACLVRTHGDRNCLSSIVLPQVNISYGSEADDLQA